MGGDEVRAYRSALTTHQSSPIPVFDRELCILGSDWRAVLTIDVGTLSELFSLADPGRLKVLHASTDKAASFDVFVGGDSVSLFLGDSRLAVLPR